MSNETAARFDERRDCIIDWYAKQTIPDGKGGEVRSGPDLHACPALTRPPEQLHLRSKFTIGEDVADIGGLALSWRAWRDSLDTPGAAERNPPLPGLQHLSNEQLFYLAYAVGW